MDLQESALDSSNLGDSLPPEDSVYRIVLVTDRDKKNKEIPAIRCFSLHSSDKGKLSVDWSKKTTPEESIARVGASYKTGTTTYKEYNNRELYGLNIGFLKSLEKIEDVVYDPIKVQPRISGKPDNQAHSLVIFNDENDPEVLEKIRDHAKYNKVLFDMKKVEELVNALRKGDT